VKFKYRDSENIVGNGKVFSSETLAELPQELRDSLESALISLDMPRIERVVRQIDGINPACGAWLRATTGCLSYSEILDAIRKCSRKINTAGEK